MSNNGAVLHSPKASITITHGGKAFSFPPRTRARRVGSWFVIAPPDDAVAYAINEHGERFTAADEDVDRFRAIAYGQEP